jgi:hypothetical protein
MPYQCDLGPGQRIYLDNSGNTTQITLASGGPGQQQQSSTQVQTGTWTESPQVARVASGVLIRCVTAQGTFLWQVQGMQIGAVAAPAWPTDRGVPMQPVGAIPTAPMPPMPPAPMAPMPPMQMGDMHLSANPMTMTMGNMTLSMGNAATPSSAPDTPRFCTQCGAAVGVGDRYCGHCGHTLG